MWSKWEQTQPIATRIIRNSLAKDRLAHAMMFHGQPLAIQLDFVKTFISAKICQQGTFEQRPCGTCSSCTRVANGTHPDVILITPDGASIKKEQIKTLQHDLSQTSFEGEEQFYIIVNAELMSVSAANSLLKFLEEPSGKQTALLLVQNPNKMLATIISRVQNIQFLPPNTQQKISGLVNQGADENLAFYVSVLNADSERVQALIQDEAFHLLVKDIETYFEQLEMQQESPLIAQIMLEKHFSKRQQALEVIQLLVAVYEHIFHRQQQPRLALSTKLQPHLSVQVCQHRLQALLLLEKQIRANTLLSLALTGYHITLMNGSEKQ